MRNAIRNTLLGLGLALAAGAVSAAVIFDSAEALSRLNQPATAPAESVSPQAPKARFCTSCGAKLTPGAKFCTSCGAKVTP